MRFMLIAKATKESEAGLPPDPRLVKALAKLSHEMAEAGVLVGSGGLAPSSMGARLRLSGGEVTVTDGPFAETKEIIGGFGIVEVESKEQAIELFRRLWQVHADIMGPSYEGEGEVRQLFDDRRSGEAAASRQGRQAGGTHAAVQS